jgi:regulatory protein
MAHPHPTNGGDEHDAALLEIEAAAMRMLAAREHSRFELARKLRQRGHPAQAIDEVLDALVERDLLSEERYVEVYLSQRIRKGYGPLRLRAELAERGIDGGLVEAALADLAPDWQVLVVRAAERKFGDSPPADYPDAARRGRFLQQRGFPVGMVRQYLAAFEAT